jgi:hypothetical protein
MINLHAKISEIIDDINRRQQSMLKQNHKIKKEKQTILIVYNRKVPKSERSNYCFIEKSKCEGQRNKNLNQGHNIFFLFCMKFGHIPKMQLDSLGIIFAVLFYFTFL